MLLGSWAGSLLYTPECLIGVSGAAHCRKRFTSYRVASPGQPRKHRWLPRWPTSSQLLASEGVDQPSDLRTCSEFFTSFTPPTFLANSVARERASSESTEPLNCTVPLKVSTLIW